MQGLFRRVASEAATRAPRATAKNLSGVAKHGSIPFPKAYISDKVLVCFSEAARISFSPTFVDIKGYLQMRQYYDTNPNKIDDELQVDFIRIILEKILEM